MAKIAHGAHIAVAAYLIDGALEQALSDAARRGAAVEVRLSGITYGPSADALIARNTAAVARLAAAGADAAVFTAGVLHLKAAVIDDQTFFDDRNFTRGTDAVICDSRAGVASEVRQLLAGAQALPDTPIAFHKGAALQQERDLITSAPTGTLEVATETFGSSELGALLAQRAALGPVDVLVNRRAYAQSATMRAALAKLAAAGASVRLSVENAKFALSSTAVWVGSANATAADPQMLDWGMTLCDAPSLHTLHAQFAAAWQSASALPADVAPASSNSNSGLSPGEKTDRAT